MTNDGWPAAPGLDGLLASCARGDQAAFRRLYDALSSRLYGVALRITRQPSLAADAVHDALLQVWRNADRFDETRGNPEGWIISLVRYRALDITRRREREVTGLDLPEQEDEGPDALSTLVGAAEVSALRGCLGELEDTRRRLVTMAFVDGLSHSELATKLAVPLGTVKSWIRRSLLSLKACLER